VTGHDHFFDTFAKFGGTDHRHLGEWIDEVATRAAAQNEQYLELMHTPDFSHTATIAKEIGWHDELSKLRDELLARGLRDDIAPPKPLSIKRKLCGGRASIVDSRMQLLPAAWRSAISAKFCVASAKEQVFAQTLLCFETALADQRFVGINLVMPEDAYTAMNDYALHMHIVAFLHALYPKTRVTLHAGELAPGFVPYEGLCCHVRLAVEQAQAERIGHGVDVMYENNPHALLKEMAANHVLVEISLTSNDVILGVSGKDHPFLMYRMFGVPVALATDDEGVSRIDLTHEYVAQFKLTISTTLSSSTWFAPAWNTASCPAQVCGARRMPSVALFQHARTMLQERKNLPPRARLSSSPAREPSSSGNLNCVFVRLKLKCEFQPEKH